ncbi:hypothetical protein L7F22_015868 [Adiantum nelumboides]|nr:hypothetical protein [Adiantum nelumboides]
MNNMKGLVVYYSWVILQLTILVLQTTSAAHWGSFSKDSCVLPGYLKYSSKLYGIKGDWESGCQSMPATVKGTYFSKPDNCVNRGLRGEYGEFHVLDSNCNPNWGSFKDDGCKGDGRRQFSSLLWDIPSGQSWEDWCAKSWAIVDGVFFFQPSRCVNTVLNIWGEFDVPDPCCGNGKADDSTTAPIHDQLRRRRLLEAPQRRHLLATCAAAGGSGGIPPHDNNGFPNTPTDACDAFAAEEFDAQELAVYLAITSSDREQESQFKVSGGKNGGIQSFDVFLPSPSSGLRFFPSSLGLSKGAVRSHTIKALAVPMMSAGDLNGGNTIPSGRWYSVSLQNNDAASRPTRIIATSQLSGCCLTMGWESSSRTLYMGHVQPYRQASSPTLQTGENLANHLRQQAQPFDGVTLSSDNIYHIGANSENFGGYGANDGLVRANVLGLIGRNAIQIVVQFVNTRSGRVDRHRLMVFL